MMNSRGAEKKAKELYGDKASVQWMDNGYKSIGKVVMGMMFQTIGSSHTTWEDAFKDAANRDAKFSKIPKEVK